jgi:hypothetical protein
MEYKGTLSTKFIDVDCFSQGAFGRGPLWTAYLGIPSDSGSNYRAANGSTAGGTTVTLEGVGLSSPSRCPITVTSKTYGTMDLGTRLGKTQCRSV